MKIFESDSLTSGHEKLEIVMERHGFEELKRVRTLHMYVFSKVIIIIIIIIIIIKPATANIAISIITIIIVNIIINIINIIIMIDL